MIDKPLLLAVLKPGHGLFNLLVLLLFLFQGGKGIVIRRARLASGPIPFSAVKLHRKLGPRAVVLALAGYAAGIALVLYDTGSVLEHPLHLSLGTVLVLILLGLYLVSRGIRGASPEARDLHFRLGVLALAVYLAEAMVGLSVLF